MTPWYWILISFFIGGWFGYFVCALIVVGSQADERIKEMKN